MTSKSKWRDLRARVLSALVLLLIGLAALMQGGAFFLLFVALIVSGMLWELTRMLTADDRLPWVVAVAGFVVLALEAYVGPSVFSLLGALVPAAIGAVKIQKDHVIYVAYGAMLMLSAEGLIYLRDAAGLLWVLWLVAVVVATDIAGYFVGKTVGGPKFWPAVSPKKTWSGTASGWVAAGLVGLAFGGPGLVLVSVVLSFASQLGDIAESAIKRRCGKKDSSQIIPGHGGLLDRFDGLMGAALAVLVISALVGLPFAPR